MILSDLPFTKFQLRRDDPSPLIRGEIIRDKTETISCQITDILDQVVIDGIPQPLLLIRVDYEDGIRKWIGSFVYENGIGGRVILDTDRIRWLEHVSARSLKRSDLDRAILVVKNRIQTSMMYDHFSQIHYPY